MKVGKPLEGFGFDTWDKKSPILRFAALGDIQVAAGYALEPGEGDKVVGASDDGPILVSGARGGHRFVALGFDPRQSDFVLRIAWPLFVLNTIDSFSETTRVISRRTAPARCGAFPFPTVRARPSSPTGRNATPGAGPRTGAR